MASFLKTLYAKLKGAFAPDTQHTTPRREDWYVYGRVSDPDGYGLSNLRVSVYDKDLLFDDRLGEVTTDNRGEFACMFRNKDFKDVFESTPDLYIKVMDKRGKVLYSSESAIRFKSKRVERFEIILDKNPY